jgi:hypothetical protein
MERWSDGVVFTAYIRLAWPGCQGLGQFDRRFRNGGKRSGSNAENRTIKNLRHMLSRRARVAGGVGISSAECPAIEAISVYPGPKSCSASSLGGKPEQMRQ